MLVAALLAGGGTWAATRPSAAEPTSTLVTVSQGTIRQTVSASGTIAPAQQADLSFAVSGTVTAVPATVGDKVAKGATLATVGADDLRTAVDSAQAGVDAAAEQVTAQQDASSTQLAAANAQLAAAKSKLTAAQQSLADATLTAPFAGTVASVDIAVGDRLGSTGGSTAASQGNATGTASAAQIVVISTDGWLVNASVGSADLGQVKKGLQVEITPTGGTAKVFGTVSSVGIIASSSSTGSATFPVTVAITGKPTGLYAGATGAVAIIVRQVTDVLTVPTFALRTVDGRTVVRQLKDGKQVDTEVKLGTAYGATTQVLSGLKAGDQVVVEASQPGANTGGGQRPGRTGGAGNPAGGGPPGGFPPGGFPPGTGGGN